MTKLRFQPSRTGADPSGVAAVAMGWLVVEAASRSFGCLQKSTREIPSVLVLQKNEWGSGY
jgi:hypothetical protein